MAPFVNITVDRQLTFSLIECDPNTKNFIYKCLERARTDHDPLWRMCAASTILKASLKKLRIQDNPVPLDFDSDDGLITQATAQNLLSRLLPEFHSQMDRMVSVYWRLVENPYAERMPSEFRDERGRLIPGIELSLVTNVSEMN
ncbi:MAG: hypothetical protein AB7G93_10020 [Bdellovibrionales bacterium]